MRAGMFVDFYQLSANEVALLYYTAAMNGADAAARPVVFGSDGETIIKKTMAH